MRRFSIDAAPIYLGIFSSISNEIDRDRLLGICDEICGLLVPPDSPPLADKDKGVDEAIMHYTSLDILPALARGERYRLYDAAGMTDAWEGMAIREFLDKSDEKKATEMLDKQIDNKAFIGSFVTNSNPLFGDEMMWLAYGHRAHGCALVFDSSRFVEFQAKKNIHAPLEERHKKYIPRQECYLSKVLYPGPENESKLSELVGKIHQEFRQYPEISRSLLDFIRFFFKAKRYERESEARIVVWRDYATGNDLSGKFPRAYFDCYEGFKPSKILLGAKVEKPRLWQQWLKTQPGTKDIEIAIS